MDIPTNYQKHREWQSIFPHTANVQDPTLPDSGVSNRNVKHRIKCVKPPTGEGSLGLFFQDRLATVLHAYNTSPFDYLI